MAPIQTLLREIGDWALRFLVTGLAITPVRIMTGWGEPMHYRRMIGLFAFFYAFLHLASYVGLEQFFDWRMIAEEIVKRSFITIGMTAFALLIPLAATSTKGMVKRVDARRSAEQKRYGRRDCHHKQLRTQWAPTTATNDAELAQIAKASGSRPNGILFGPVDLVGN